MDEEDRTAESIRQAKVGDIVSYVLSEGNSYGQVRPGIVVRNWHEGGVDPGLLQLQVFTDDIDGRWNDGLPQVMWATSIPFNENKAPGTWHWL